MPPRFAIDKTVTLNNLRFHYRDWGGEGRSLLLLHSLGGTAHVWDLVAPLLVESAKVIALDLRGHGNSDKPPTGYTFDVLAGDLLTLIEQLGLTDTVLVGHGWGARVALETAVKAPPAGVVLVDGALVDHRKTPRTTLEKAYGPLPYYGEFAAAVREQVINGAPQGLVTPAVEAAIMAQFEIEPDDRVFPRLPRDLRPTLLDIMRDQDVLRLYGRLACPLLLMPVRGSEAVNAGLTIAEQAVEHVDVVWLAPATLEIPLERPHAVAKGVRRFLTERLP